MLLHDGVLSSRLHDRSCYLSLSSIALSLLTEELNALVAEAGGSERGFKDVLVLAGRGVVLVFVVCFFDGPLGQAAEASADVAWLVGVADHWDHCHFCGLVVLVVIVVVMSLRSVVVEKRGKDLRQEGL